MLKIVNLCKTFGRRTALRDIRLEIPAGCIFALLGPNGSGKTTLIKSLLNLVTPDPGSVIELAGVKTFSPEYGQKLTYLPQFPGLLPHLTTRETVALLESINPSDASLKEQLIADLGIGDFWDRPLGELSGGMRQKVNILQCFMFPFEIAVVDEPTASLDPQIAHYVKALFRNFKERGKTILFTTHIMAEVEELADRMALLVDGRIHLEAVPHEFVRDSDAKNLEEAILRFWSEPNV